MIILTHLPLPVSKNALHVPVRCGKWTKMVRSQKARLRGLEICAAIWRQIGGKPSAPIFTRPVSMAWTVTFPDRRVRDGQNYMEHLSDCLQEAGIVSNDKLIVHEVRETMPGVERPGFINLTIQEIP
jgi:hypothetical protein